MLFDVRWWPFTGSIEPSGIKKRIFSPAKLLWVITKSNNNWLFTLIIFRSYISITNCILALTNIFSTKSNWNKYRLNCESQILDDASEIINEPIKFLHDDTVAKSEYCENTSPIHSETEHEIDNVFIDETSFTPLISPPIIKKVLPSEWKTTTSSPIRTRRLYGTSTFSDENSTTREIYNRSTKTNLPSYERPSFKLRSPFMLPKLDLPDAMMKGNSTDHKLREEDISSDTVHENPSSSTLQHLIKDKPKRQKKHASNKNVVLSQWNMFLVVRWHHMQFCSWFIFWYAHYELSNWMSKLTHYPNSYQNNLSSFFCIYFNIIIFFDKWKCIHYLLYFVH